MWPARPRASRQSLTRRSAWPRGEPARPSLRRYPAADSLGAGRVCGRPSRSSRAVRLRDSCRRCRTARTSRSSTDPAGARRTGWRCRSGARWTRRRGRGCGAPTFPAAAHAIPQPGPGRDAFPCGAARTGARARRASRGPSPGGRPTLSEHRAVHRAPRSHPSRMPVRAPARWARSRSCGPRPGCGPPPRHARPSARPYFRRRRGTRSERRRPSPARRRHPAS